MDVAMEVMNSGISQVWEELRYEHDGNLSLTYGKQANSSSELQQTREIKVREMPTIEEAIASFNCMDGLPPIGDIICTLQKCRKEKNLVYAGRAHLQVHGNGLEAFGEVGNFLVPMFVECGSLCKAQQVFHRLLHRNEYSWTALIHGYIECGDSYHALNLFQRMKEDCIRPSKYTFLALLKACTRLRCVGRGLEVHAEIVREELLRDPFVGSNLVDMYAKCGSLEDAREVFDELPIRGVVSWTALIAGYSEQGLWEEGLNCFDQMQLEGVSPNEVTFVCILKACGSIGAVDKGQELYLEIIKGGFEGDTAVGNTLVDMYAKFGSLLEARKVFDKLLTRDVVSWNALITGHTECGLGEEALMCLELMQMEGISPNAVSFICSLKACGSIGALDRGRELHVEIAKEGFEGESLVGNTLVDMYAKCGLMVEAREVFKELPSQGLVSWTALITGYAEKGLGEEALSFLEDMKLEGVLQDAVTFVCALKACGSIGAIDKGREIHSEIAEEEFERDLFVGSALVDLYGKCGSLAEARDLFEELPTQDVATWSAIITGYAENGLGEEALNCMDQMQLDGLFPDAVTFLCSLKACGSMGAIDKGRELHAKIAEEGLERDLYIGNALIDMYAKCGVLKEACKIFDELPTRDVVSWNTVILGCADQGKHERAVILYRQMQEQGVSPDSVCYGSILKACCSTTMLETGKKLHSQIQAYGLKATERVASIVLIDMYGKCGSMTAAQQVFDSLTTRDLEQWTALIAGYARQGENESVFDLFKRMTEEGIHPNGITFLLLLSVCSHAGLLYKGQQYFEAMSREYGITSNIRHYNCMIDLLSRSGQFHEALLMLETMPFQPDLVTWSTVLSACQKWGNVELGKKAFERIMTLGEKHPPAFILMSNIYANAHMLDDAQIIQAMSEDIQVWNEPGKNWVDTGGYVDRFVMGDLRLPQSKDIHARLQKCSVGMEDKGYI